MMTAPRERAETPEPVAVMVVEDEILIRVLIGDLLRDEGYQVVEAANAQEALTILETPTPISLILTDVRMPGGMDGLALARLVRARRPEIRLIVVSSHLEAALSPSVADVFMVKPFDADKLVETVHGLLAEAADVD